MGRFVKIVVPKTQLLYGREFGVTRKEAEKEFIKGFRESAKNRPSFWKNLKIKFQFI